VEIKTVNVKSLVKLPRNALLCGNAVDVNLALVNLEVNAALKELVVKQQLDANASIVNVVKMLNVVKLELVGLAVKLDHPVVLLDVNAQIANVNLEVNVVKMEHVDLKIVKSKEEN
jgi:hypothetical protein